jgi:hypothetical protein
MRRWIWIALTPPALAAALAWLPEVEMPGREVPVEVAGEMAEEVPGKAPGPQVPVSGEVAPESLAAAEEDPGPPLAWPGSGRPPTGTAVPVEELTLAAAGDVIFLSMMPASLDSTAPAAWPRFGFDKTPPASPAARPLALTTGLPDPVKVAVPEEGPGADPLLASLAAPPAISPRRPLPRPAAAPEATLPEAAPEVARDTPPEPATDTAPPDLRRVTADTLTLRDGPSETARDLGTLADGAVTELLGGPHFGWALVRSEAGDTGWVRAAHLEQVGG